MVSVPLVGRNSIFLIIPSGWNESGPSISANGIASSSLELCHVVPFLCPWFLLFLVNIILEQIKLVKMRCNTTAAAQTTMIPTLVVKILRTTSQTAILWREKQQHTYSYNICFLNWICYNYSADKLLIRFIHWVFIYFHKTRPKVVFPKGHLGWASLHLWWAWHHVKVHWRGAMLEMWHALQ